MNNVSAHCTLHISAQYADIMLCYADNWWWNATCRQLGIVSSRASSMEELLFISIFYISTTPEIKRLKAYISLY
jgi:hypothetical protein